MNILVVIIDRSGGRINSLRDLATFLKNNVKLSTYRVREKSGLPFGIGDKEYTTKPAALYSGCKVVLKRFFDLTDSEAEDAMKLLYDAGFIWYEPYETWIEGRGPDKLVIFNI